MRQTLAVVLVLSVIGAALAMQNPKADFADRRRAARMHEKMKPMRPGLMKSANEFMQRFEDEADRARQFGMDNLRKKTSKISPYAEEMVKMRSRMAAGQERFGSQMNFRNDRQMKANFKKAARRQP